MTEGSIFGHLLAYSVPLVFGNFLQLTYNAVDSIIVSKGSGVLALSAVSVSNPISTIIVLGMSGIGIGASVYMSRFYGANEEEKLKRALSTTILFGTFASFIILLLGFIFSPQILRALNVPENILSMAVTYLRIIFIGNIFTFQYNIMSSALRSVGDSRTPVLFIGISSVMNACMDAVFIFVFHMGVFGAALATAIAEGVSAVLCYIYVYRRIPLLQLRKKDLVFDTGMLKKILQSGMITALQQSCQPIGKLLIQSVINTQGVDLISAFNAVSRVDDFARIPAQSISHGMMTCTAQNRGAGHMARTKETLWKGIVIGLCYYPVICTLTLLFRYPLMQLFAPVTGGGAMVSAGVSYLSIKAFTFVMPCLTNAMQGYFRGMNQMTITLVSTVIQITTRTIFSFLLVPRIGINGEAYGCLIGWAVMLLFEYGYYYFVQRKSRIYQTD